MPPAPDVKVGVSTPVPGPLTQLGVKAKVAHCFTQMLSINKLLPKAFTDVKLMVMVLPA